MLAEAGHHVVGLARKAVWPAGWKPATPDIELHSCDLCDGSALERFLRTVQPARIFHAAGYAQVGKSFQEIDPAWEGNLLATRRLYEAVVRWGGRPRILYIGSGVVYGDGSEPGRPLDESRPLSPNSPYASSKAAADLVSYQYSRDPGLAIIRARPFNHIGPRQGPQFAVAHFAQQLVAIERGLAPAILEVGNLKPQRDLTDVRDTATAYVLLMDDGRPGEAYNIGCGQSHSMQTVLDRLLALTGLKVQIRQRSELLRPTDLPGVHVDVAKLRRETGWAPRFSLDQTLADTLQYWRTQPPAP
jgi:GDP-4-dehydro-6-deoxy-D-mannose reductase